MSSVWTLSFQKICSHKFFKEILRRNSVYLRQNRQLLLYRCLMQVGNWTEDHGLGLLDSSLLKPPGKNKYKIVVVPTVSWFMTSTVGSKLTFFYNSENIIFVTMLSIWLMKASESEKVQVQVQKLSFWKKIVCQSSCVIGKKTLTSCTYIMIYHDDKPPVFFL